MCFKLNYFHKYLKKNTYRRVATFLENAGCYKNRNPSHIILLGLSLSHFQMFQQIVVDWVTFLLKHRAIVHWTLLNGITDVFMRMFWNTYTENFGKKNIQKNVFSAVLIPDWKFLCRYFSGSAQKRKDILRSRNFQEAFANVCLFLLRYRLAMQNSLLQQKHPNKSVSRQFCQEIA